MLKSDVIESVKEKSNRKISRIPDIHLLHKKKSLKFSE